MMSTETLSKSEVKELKEGRAQLLNCKKCGKETYFGAMNLLSLAIRNHEPSCSFECNKALGQVDT